jgi:hypothetical protein
MPILFDSWYAWLSSALGLTPSKSYLDVAHDDVEVRMGWAFRARFPRSAIASASVSDLRPLSRGVHGFRGCWLVNGSGRGIVTIRLAPDQRARVIGVPVRLRELLLSVDEPSRVAASLGLRAEGGL